MGSDIYSPYLINEAHEIAKELISNIAKDSLISKHEKDAIYLDEILSSRYEYEYGIMCAYCYLVNDLKIDKNQAKKYLKICLKGLVKDSYKVLTPAEKALLENIIEIVENFSSCEAYCVEWAQILGLIEWHNGKWHLTDLGKKIISIPPYNFNKAILMLEAMSFGGAPCCIGIDFISSLYDFLLKRNILKISEISDKLKCSSALALLWLKKLSKMGVIHYSIKEDTIIFTQKRLNILKEILNYETSPLYKLIIS